MQFNRLRLAGFKSFVEPTEVVIDPGLTGVVGPNGCGKSNLVEALRWVMGETSARKMRGGAMDDVIFAGTATRPSRNLAEVSLQLDNRSREAPPAYNEMGEIEVTRRIERENGSTYRINGREVRARDVQLLFADLATGAHSTAMVSQGRVGALINAKPTDRRGLLEEAAGISGLHSRRHEAELRLKAAEGNIERVEDVTQQLEAQLQGLKRQARQASRYRNLSGHIRRAEAIQLHLRHAAAGEALQAARARLETLSEAVSRLTLEAAAAARRQAEAAEALAPLRQAEAEAAARLHRMAVARDGLEAEEKRARDQQSQLRGRIEQIAADGHREEAHRQDAAQALDRLQAESEAIERVRASEDDALAAADAAVQAAAAEVAEKQQLLDALTERAATEAARRRSLEQQRSALADRLGRLERKATETAAELAKLAAEAEDAGRPDAIAAEVESRLVALQMARERMEAVERERLQAQSAEAVARETLQEAQGAAGRLAAEEKGLSKLLAVAADDLWPPLIDAVQVAAGYEAALGAALGEDLDVPADAAAPAHWQVLPPYEHPPALPEGAVPLSGFVAAPPALARRLGQIGVVADEDGPQLRRSLAQGQRLVSRRGALWRWDGYTRAADAAAPAAIRLEQRNRLAELRLHLADAERALAGVRETCEAACQRSQRMRDAEAETRSRVRQRESELTQAQQLHAATLQRMAARAARLAGLQSAAEQIAADLAEAQSQQAETGRQIEALPLEQEGRSQIGALRQAVEERRGALAEARQRLEQQRRDAAERVRRLQAVALERRSWAARAESAARQLAQLGERREAAAAELAAIETLPAEIAERRAALFSQIEVAEAERRAAADALAAAEAHLADSDRLQRAAQEALSTAREARARAEAETEHATAGLAGIVARIREVLDCEPEAALAAGEVPDDEALPELAAVELRLDRLKKERDGMGPVNLRADIEAGEVEQQLTSLQTERADLEAAIARLRQGISSLNREGRERLLTAFQQVDQHFQRLFSKIFGGGHAHLTLTESADPLEAGLEIMASPPGKRLQVLSLLSGGEQALTALSLLFAVFLTNPAPICVLDEVDAPLDDANVERLCDLLDEMAQGGATRFLVVTHHPITMARMDRLFGVTMAERGISQLVSVDLTTAESLRQSA